ncbi:MAG: hypothetical protein Q8P67_05755 [archaeon]|nr:hypothetical protein [archaeon]
MVSKLAWICFKPSVKGFERNVLFGLERDGEESGSEDRAAISLSRPAKRSFKLSNSSIIEGEEEEGGRGRDKGMRR